MHDKGVTNMTRAGYFLPQTILVILLVAAAAADGIRSAPDGWRPAAPRDEIRPQFDYQPKGGKDGKGSLVITAVGRVIWQDDNGRQVLRDTPVVSGYLKGALPVAEPEYPTDKATDADGWTEVSDVYQAPAKATHAVVELHLRWASRARVEWSSVSLAETPPPPERRARLAAVHFRPAGGKTPMDNCQQFAPLVAEAARQRADLVVLPETLTYYGLGKPYVDVAEPIPGPSTEYFGELARKHNLYIVAGLIERDHHLIYNVAVMLGPDGKIVGRYRKVALPRGEIEGGITPGNEYPVFETRFGKVGMMVCYDG